MTPQALRASILQLAIQGKLVPQHPEEGTAEDLYQQIQAEKKRLIAEGKIKKEKPLPPIVEKDIPFEIPETWKWVRFTEVVNIARGASPRPIKQFITDASDGINWIKIGDTDKGGKYINHAKEKIIPEGVRYSRMVHAGDFLLTNSMSFGRPYILNIDGCVHDGWLIFSNYQSAYVKDFLYHLLSSPFSYMQFCGKVSGAVVKNLNIDKVLSACMPLPPLEEQKRIVAKIEEMLPLVERYGEAYEQLQAFNKRFPDDLRKSILQEAIQGKLVPQRPEEGTAEDLYQQIQAEKKRLIASGTIKKEKPLPPIEESEIPFDIPETWKWVQLGDIVYNRGQKVPNGDFSYIDIGSINNQKNCLNKEDNILSCDKAPSRARKIVGQGDILYATVRPYLHNVCIIDRDFSAEPIASTGFAAMSCIEGVYNKYLFYYLLSPEFDLYANRTDNAKGVAYPAISDKRLYKAPIALPPYEEQKRIVAKIEEIFELYIKSTK